MENLNQLWQTIMPYLASVASVVGAIATIVTALLSVKKSRATVEKSVNEFLGKIDLETLMKNAATLAAENGIARVKACSFTTSIQPLVESELLKINERANAYVKGSIQEAQSNYIKLLAVIKALAAYFDNSIGVSDAAKEELRRAISDAETKPQLSEAVIEVKAETSEPEATREAADKPVEKPSKKVQR